MNLYKNNGIVLFPVQFLQPVGMVFWSFTEWYEGGLGLIYGDISNKPISIVSYKIFIDLTNDNTIENINRNLLIHGGYNYIIYTEQ